MIARNSPAARLDVYVGLGGLVAASLQAWSLRHLLRGGPWWVPLTAAGWSLAAATVWLNEFVMPRTRGTLGAMQYLAVVISGGVVLGVAYRLGWWLLRRDRTTPS